VAVERRVHVVEVRAKVADEKVSPAVDPPIDFRPLVTLLISARLKSRLIPTVQSEQYALIATVIEREFLGLSSGARSSRGSHRGHSGAAGDQHSPIREERGAVALSRRSD